MHEDVGMPWGGYTTERGLESYMRVAAQWGWTLRAWKYRRAWTSVFDAKRKALLKRLWCEPDELSVYLEELRRAGYPDPRPSGWPYAWNQANRTPRPNASTLYALRSEPQASRPQAWQEAVRPGRLSGPWHVYDLCSAYAWAASYPLPDPRTTVYVPRPSGRRHGVYLVSEVDWRVPLVPRRFRREFFTQRGWWVTREELERLDAHHVRFVRGLEWTRQVDLRPRLDHIFTTFSLPVAKKILQRFWGSWLADEGPEEWIMRPGGSTVRRLPGLQHNPIWAWFILSRVATRCAEASPHTAHVFTDSVIVPHALHESGDIGGWVLKAVHHDGVWIRGAGSYGVGTEVIKHAGVKYGEEGHHQALARAGTIEDGRDQSRPGGREGRPCGA